MNNFVAMRGGTHGGREEGWVILLLSGGSASGKDRETLGFDESREGLPKQVLRSFDAEFVFERKLNSKGKNAFKSEVFDVCNDANNHTKSNCIVRLFSGR